MSVQFCSCYRPIGRLIHLILAACINGDAFRQNTDYLVLRDKQIVFNRQASRRPCCYISQLLSVTRYRDNAVNNGNFGPEVHRSWSMSDSGWLLVTSFSEGALVRRFHGSNTEVRVTFAV